MTSHKAKIKKKRSKKIVRKKEEKAVYDYLGLKYNLVKFAQFVGFDPEPWQKKLLLNEHKRIIILCPRGAGKSILTALIAVHHAIYTPNAFILMFSKSERQSMELFKKAIDFYKKQETNVSLSPSQESAHRVELKNGSRIMSLPSSTETIVGYHDVTLLIIDEAALVKDELYQRARPMLHHDIGRLILLSTPFGRRGFFYEEWTDFLQNPDTVWDGITVTTNECPHMNPEFLAEERAKLGDRVYRSEYECSFEDDATAMFKKEWLNFYDPNLILCDAFPDGMPQEFDVMIQSWDPTSTKTMQSDFCVGQVWGRVGANMYLIEQVRGKWDFDETVQHIRSLTAAYPDARAKIIEAQSIGAGLSAHIKNLGIPGVIPIPAIGKKEMRALSTTPYFQAHNIYLPKPDTKHWMRDYLNELLNFPNVLNDDCVDATSQAINQLHNTLFDTTSAKIADTTEASIDVYGDYRIGWIPARTNEHGIFCILNVDHNAIVYFERTRYANMQKQIEQAFILSSRYDSAIWAQEGVDDALLKVLAQRGAAIRRVEMNEQSWLLAYENLALLIEYKKITLPNNLELLAELEVFKSQARLDGKPDYTLQAGQNAAIRALCLVTFNIRPDIEAPFYDMEVEKDTPEIPGYFNYYDEFGDDY